MLGLKLPFAASEAVVAHEVAKETMEAKNSPNTNTQTTGTDAEDAPTEQNSKTAAVDVYPESHYESRSSSDDDLDKVDERFQHGVQMAQAMTQVWTRNQLIIAFIL